MPPFTPPPSDDTIPPYKPLDTQKSIGGDMSMMFFVRSRPPKRFSSPQQQQIKGLNVETIAILHFPSPPWLSSPEYSVLQPSSEEDTWGFFSLNISIYNQPLISSDWDDMWFCMYGRAHLYSFTWEVESGEDVDATDDVQEYAIPALVVRDRGYQPISARSFDIADDFPATSPTVTFTGPIVGPIVGSGLTHLQSDAAPGLGSMQRRCCGFMQLSTFTTLRNSTKTPFKGFHLFQVFVIFPVNTNPWTILCKKKMTERQDTQFQPGTVFSCTGKVAGFLNHDMMLHPPPLAQDYIFIVVPDSWTFHDRSTRSLMSSPFGTTSTKNMSTNPLDRLKFISPSKRTLGQTGSRLRKVSPSPTVVSDGETSPTSPSQSPDSPSIGGTPELVVVSQSTKQLNSSDEASSFKKARTANNPQDAISSTQELNSDETTGALRNRTQTRKLRSISPFCGR